MIGNHVQIGPKRSVSRRGATLAELLIVLAVFALFASLLLPAIQMVREKANVAKCGNNLRQISLAVHQFDSSHGRLPPAWGSMPEFVGPPRGVFGFGSAFFHLLPQMGQNPLYGKSKIAGLPGAPFGFYSCGQVMRDTVAEYVCPSDPTVSTAGLGSYLANERVFSRFLLRSKPLAHCASDGLSCTIFVAEGLGQFSSGRGGIAELHWASEFAMFLPDSFPECRRVANSGGAYRPASSHNAMQLGMGDGSVRSFPLANHKYSAWVALVLPDDGKSGDES